MPLLDTMLIITATAGVLILLFGLFFSKYPKSGLFMNLKDGLSLDGVVGIKPVNKFLNFITPPAESRLYKLSRKVIKEAEVEISMQVLFLLKIISILLTAAIVLAVRYTNIDVMKISVISKPTQSISIFMDKNKESYSYNFTLYNAVLKRVGHENLRKLDKKGRVAAVKKVLPEFLTTNSIEDIESKAESFVATFNTVEGIKLVDGPTLAIIILSFWLPEILLLFKQLLLSNRYKQEVIKLENIFELLGGIQNFRTIDIITEMEKSTGSYRKHLILFKDTFKRDKEIALKTLKAAVKNNRFSKLVDIIRIYSLIDKEVAIDILERNRQEKEEQIYLTAQEDVDVLDIIAFISIVPILWELANLMMKPMLDMIFDAFKFI